MEFVYNGKTGNIMVDDKHIVYFNKWDGAPFIKKRGERIYLSDNEMASLSRAIKWFEGHLGCDFNYRIGGIEHGIL